MYAAALAIITDVPSAAADARADAMLVLVNILLMRSQHGAAIEKLDEYKVGTPLNFNVPGNDQHQHPRKLGSLGADVAGG